MFHQYFPICVALVVLVAGDNGNETTSDPKPSTKLPLVTTTSTPYTPSKDPITNLYALKSQDGNYCIMVKAALRLGFQYKNPDDKDLFGYVDIPGEKNGTLVTGNCSVVNNAQVLILKFLNNWSMNFTFKQNTTLKEYNLESISIKYDIQHNNQPFPDAKSLNGETTFAMEDGHVKVLGSYMCFSQRVFNINSNSSEKLGLMNLTTINEQYQAFVNVSEIFFSQAVKRCDQDSVSNLIPIVVGAALCALIVLVLVAYLIGRHHKRGYESV
ncbi:hypothetical protein HELRODRAFT_195045 [Helobdella robusta]|uniref:Lysosome-associated membrane glycoprotein 1 n=1 Tax=Helobdella robusta TaxID=6412 RepID=T1FWP6_HELRO|nr:hypothetical protein HELRODRAFT_195045 [Helobdella robusta]ESO09655.1 hypothetical protein HELRODRAFT_195045 [Helobdella robusta]